MQSINISRQDLVRGIRRALEIRASSSDVVVNATYDAKVGPAGHEFLVAVDAETNAHSRWRFARFGADHAVEAVDQLHRFARALLAIHAPEVAVPGTLKELPTDTEVKAALEHVLSAVAGRRGEPWADGLLAGPFTTLVPDAVAKLGAAVVATTEFESARVARREAGKRVYPMLVAFRELLSHSSPDLATAMKRLRPRTHRPAVTADPPAVTPPTATPPTATPPVVTAPPAATEPVRPTNGTPAAPGVAPPAAE